MTPMSPVWGYVAGGFIVAMMVTFIGIWIWAWRKKRAPTFDRLAQLPVEDAAHTDVNIDEDHP